MKHKILPRDNRPVYGHSVPMFALKRCLEIYAASTYKVCVRV